MSYDDSHSTALPGGIRIFRIFEIDVYLHWSWALAAYYFMQQSVPDYEAPIWAAADVLGLFGIVLLHEFGHSLACRSVGGKANVIMLWPLGGAAFIEPPMRAGASLWSSAAGPLVNVVLFPFLFAAWYGYSVYLEGDDPTDLGQFLSMMLIIDVVLFVFNMLPIYPLDGGQIFRDVLWFFIGPSRSLTIAAYVGLVGIAVGAGLAVVWQDLWLGVLVYFAGVQCWNGLQEAKRLKYQEPVRRSVQPDMLGCPACHQPPPIGPHWQCDCGRLFDLPGENGMCTECSRRYAEIVCPYCMQASPILDWRT